jgi:hypothetical protein
VSGIADFSFYPPVSEYLLVPAGTAVQLTGDGHIEHITTILPSGEKAPTHVQALTTEPVTPSTPGRYVWMLDAKWDDGSANYYFGIEVAPPPDQVPDVLHLRCSRDSVALESGVVRAQRDGVHIAVDANDDVEGADIVTGSTHEEFADIGLDPHEDGTRGIAIAPGSWSVGCYTGAGGGIRPSDIGTARVAAFTVVDPGGLYPPDVLGCDSATTTTIDVTGSVAGSDQNWDSILADTTAAIPGLLPTDTVRDGGYPDGSGSKDGPHPVVIRDGSVIATLHFREFVASGGAWSVDLESCTGSGLGDRGAVVDPTPAPTPDVAVVRCTADGTELDTPVVALQSDGLHVDVTSESLSIIVQLAPDGVDSKAVAATWDGSEHQQLVMNVPAGSAQIGCRTREGGSITGGPAEYPDLFVPILILADTKA